MYVDIETKKLEDDLKTILGKSREMSLWSDKEDLKYLTEAILNFNKILKSLPEDMKDSILRNGFKVSESTKDINIPASLIIEISIKCLEEFAHELKAHTEENTERVSLEDNYNDIVEIINNLKVEQEILKTLDKNNKYNGLDLNQAMIQEIRRASHIEFNLAKLGNEEYLQLVTKGKIRIANAIDPEHFFYERENNINNKIPVFTNIIAKLQSQQKEKLVMNLDKIKEIGQTYFKDGKIPTNTYLWKENLKDVNSLSFKSQEIMEKLISKYEELVILDGISDLQIAEVLEKNIEEFYNNLKKEENLKENVDNELKATEIRDRCNLISQKYFKTGKMPTNTYNFERQLSNPDISSELKEAIRNLIEKISNTSASKTTYVDYWKILRPYVEEVYKNEEKKEKVDSEKTENNREKDILEELKSKKEEYKKESFFEKMKKMFKKRKEENNSKTI